MNFKPPSYFMQAMAPVVAQRAMKRKLAAAFSIYTKFLDDPAVGHQTPLVYGPSGSGKTFGVELCCEASDLPFTSVNAAGISAAGYKGITLRDLLAQHYLVHRRSEGIIFVDEIDKKMRGAMRTNDGEQLAMGTNFQGELLRYVEREDVFLQDEAKDLAGLREEDPEDPDNESPDSWVPVTFETRRAMFVLAGAFEGLHRLVARRMGDDPEYTEESRLWERAAPDDFRRYGMLPELVNRCSVAAYVRPLKGHEIIEIVEMQELPRWLALFEAIGCRLELDAGAIARVAHLAVQERTGARGAVLRLNHVLGDVFTEADEHQLTSCLVDAMVMDTAILPLEPAPAHHVDQAAPNGRRAILAPLAPLSAVAAV
jgi:ATP-dependent Clp protease ATP-binding subunit ClpX